jgi:hypothetical protein
VIVLIIVAVVLFTGGMGTTDETNVDLNVDVPTPSMPEAPSLPEAPDVPAIEPPTAPAE